MNVTDQRTGVKLLLECTQFTNTQLQKGVKEIQL